MEYSKRQKFIASRFREKHRLIEESRIVSDFKSLFLAENFDITLITGAFNAYKSRDKALIYRKIGQEQLPCGAVLVQDELGEIEMKVLQEA